VIIGVDISRLENPGVRTCSVSIPRQMRPILSDDVTNPTTEMSLSLIRSPISRRLDLYWISAFLLLDMSNGYGGRGNMLYEGRYSTVIFSILLHSDLLDQTL
jgi:hypothetical protein